MTTTDRLVMIVDDQPELLRLFSRGLEGAGYRVATAETAEAAMQIIDAEPPDAMLIDLKMPFINGMGMLYRVRKTYPRLPVAIITGMQNLDKDTLQEMTRLDAAVHFKPLSIAQVCEIVDGLVAGK